MRTQTDERRFFTTKEKEFILSKSNNCCCRCGKGLSLFDKEYTVEHVIPLSKGGTNSISNLVALCMSCNMKKDNSIIHPRDYFKYLKDEYYEEIKQIYDIYCEETSWFSTRNYTREDIVDIGYESVFDILSGEKLVNQYDHMLHHAATLKKCTSEDLPELYDYVCRYNKKIGLPAEKEEIKTLIDDVYKVGCVYKLYHGYDIIAVIPIAIHKNHYLGPEEEHYSFLINGLPALYQKNRYKLLIHNALVYILGCLANLNKYKAVSVMINVPEKDEYIQSVVETVCLSGKKAKVVDDLFSYLDIRIIEPDEERCEMLEKMISEISFGEMFKIVSDGIVKGMKLKSFSDVKKNMKSSQNQKRANKQMKKMQKRENVIDEYDIRYYL